MAKSLPMEHGNPALLEVDGATLVRGGRCILDNLSLQIAPGEHSAILGPNGCGKSSLIQLLTRQHYPQARDDGRPSVRILGQEQWDIFELRAQLGIVSADLHNEFTAGPQVCGLDAVLSGFFASRGVFRHHPVTDAMRQRARAALATMDALHLAQKHTDVMSTGEARRILIARALVCEPRALVLDEPTTGLDPVARLRFLERLRRVARLGTTVVLITHHVEEIIPEIQRVVLLREGRVFAEGSKADVLRSERLAALFGAKVLLRQVGDYFASEFSLTPESTSASRGAP